MRGDCAVEIGPAVSVNTPSLTVHSDRVKIDGMDEDGLFSPGSLPDLDASMVGDGTVRGNWLELAVGAP